MSDNPINKRGKVLSLKNIIHCTVGPNLLNFIEGPPNQSLILGGGFKNFDIIIGGTESSKVVD